MSIRIEDDINMIYLEKDNGEKYVFIFADNQKKNALRIMGKFASNKELNFSWYDAYVLCCKIRNLSSND